MLYSVMVEVIMFLASPVTLISAFLGVSSAISDDDVFLLLMTGFEEDCLLFISRVPYYILINKRDGVHKKKKISR